jgi:hypothetical protein
MVLDNNPFQYIFTKYSVMNRFNPIPEIYASFIESFIGHKLTPKRRKIT